MEYISTRGNYDAVSAAEAIRLGMVPTGGLFVPKEIPQFSKEEIIEMQEMKYQEIAKKVLSVFLNDYTNQELKEAINSAYNTDKFTSEEITPLHRLNDNCYFLELWHGPTAAFKDLALQLLPYLLVQAIEKQELEEEVLILVATSGDTGKAALEGFKDVDGISIIVFYPQQGVSKVQEHQMVTTGGDNTSVVAVAGNFDDCQSSVKEIFGDKDFNELIEKKGYQFSSANSINWGRLVPQIIYYFASYADLLSKDEIETGEKINVTVPTGNFGNILAGYYAYRMGLPINKFICASNDNNILTDFFDTGVYDKDRSFKETISPAMDILISSNLERFLFEITGHDSEKINNWYQQLREDDEFTIDNQTKEKIAKIFVGQYATEEETEEKIKEIYQEYNYVIDPHTAVGVKAYHDYLSKCDDKTKTIINSTASPYKFSSTVLSAIDDGAISEKIDEFKVLDRLEEETGITIHPGLKNLAELSVRHNCNCRVEDIRDMISQIIDE
ncbi:MULTISPECIES: threonine synthase [unclassified Candidatus Frackibacter]|uniref:threonine synthase n=1 Tax=unclassified Candidatus Frackibacter TaxID=2648818 RepID=UPI000880D566|nr:MULTISPECIES: threonine synthase [unclassified Candidatus Frackibacter]SDC59152.1 L-threonine synthase [Candidatus Frackibacter sp. WG11]SEM42529.1 L-threonine synthase [Candidatus Frackibacter sp. WG12]SFL85407.1 L-threonine synthase [Candidatus Frackibacter sp. WG13]